MACASETIFCGLGAGGVELLLRGGRQHPSAPGFFSSRISSSAALSLAS